MKIKIECWCSLFSHHKTLKLHFTLRRIEFDWSKETLMCVTNFNGEVSLKIHILLINLEFI